MEQVRRVLLPFLPEFREAVVSGRKTLTCRLRPYGRAGDVLESPFGVRLVLGEVRRVPLSYAAEHWAEEGASSWQDFVETWNRCYPEAPFELGRLVWVHEFRVEKVSV